VLEKERNVAKFPVPTRRAAVTVAKIKLEGKKKGCLHSANEID